MKRSIRYKNRCYRSIDWKKIEAVYVFYYFIKLQFCPPLTPHNGTCQEPPLYVSQNGIRRIYIYIDTWLR